MPDSDSENSRAGSPQPLSKCGPKGYSEHLFTTAARHHRDTFTLEDVIRKIHDHLRQPELDRKLADRGAMRTHLSLSLHEARFLQEEGAVQTVRRGLGFADDALVDFSLYLHGMPLAREEGEGRLPADPRGPCAEIWIERVEAQMDAQGGSTVFRKVLPEARVVFEGNEPVGDIPDSRTALGDGVAMVMETGRRVRDFPAADWYLARAYQHLYSGLNTEKEVRAAFRDDPGFAKFMKRMLEHPIWSNLRRGHGPVLEDVACELRDLADQHQATRPPAQPWLEYLKAIQMSTDEFWELFNGLCTLEEYVDRVMKNHAKAEWGSVEECIGKIVAEGTQNYVAEWMGTNTHGMTPELVDAWIEPQRASPEALAAPETEPSPTDLPAPPTTPRLPASPIPSPTRAAPSPPRAGSPPPWPWIYRQTQTRTESNSPPQGGWINILGTNAH
jgi:hypothetical protein